jgi:hypothetical protein
VYAGELPSDHIKQEIKMENQSSPLFVAAQDGRATSKSDSLSANDVP